MRRNAFALVLLCSIAFVVHAYAGLDVPPSPVDTSALVKTVNQVAPTNGNVPVPTVQRMVSPPLDISTGTVTWTFPNAFVNMPTCWATIASSNANFVFSAPVTTAISQTSVTVTLSAANKILAVSLGSLTVWATPPSGATVTLSCVGALP